ncbi:MAG: Bifunctional polymyxin resistance protein ArnA [Candidatus Scalindua arabica]|uniref:Bifunctional polymyxin resistance protein ArnA n=1 Tax=Candidatus Scalindua arabica TaxID=1127984 RepID=A0A941W3V5_9BACT|nr:Bifunctional polymyxin resistance protein ArnA [Candidatus Scalindua arabica]
MKKIVMCGSHTGGAPAIRSLLSEGYQFQYFVCLTPEQSERYCISGYYDYSEIARDYGIPVYHPETYSLKSKEDEKFFKDNKFDLLIQGGWQRLFPENILAALTIGAIGIHGSSDFLPKGRGRSPLNWSLIEDKKRFIMHLFLIKSGVDDGDVFDFTTFDINEFDDIETLYFKYAIVYKKLMLRSLPGLLQGSFTAFPQNGEPSYYARRTQSDGLIDWETMDVWQIYNFTRAQTKPYPGAYAFMNGKKYTIWKCRIFDTRLTYKKAQYGECVEEFEGKMIINCRGGLLLLDEFEVCED